MADYNYIKFVEDIMVKTDKQIRAILATLPETQAAAVRVIDIPLSIGSNGTPILVDDEVFFRLSLGGTVVILDWSLGAMVAGVATASSITVDIQSGATLATVATICSTSLPALAAQSELTEQPPDVSWTPVLIDPTWVMAKVTATDGVVEVVTLTLHCYIA